VVPGFPTIDVAGFLGSTLWLIWIMLTGIQFLKHVDITSNQMAG